MFKLRVISGLIAILLGTLPTTANADIPRLSSDSLAIRACTTPTEMECLENFSTILPNGKTLQAELLKSPVGSYVDVNGQNTDYNVSTWSIVDASGKFRKITMTAYILPEKHVNPAYKRYTPTMWIGLGELTKEDVSSGIKFKISIRSSWLTPQGAGMFGSNAEMLDEKIAGGRRYTFTGSPILTPSLTDPKAWANLDTAKSESENPTFYFLIDHWSSLPKGSFYDEACAESGYYFGSSNAIIGGQPYMSDLETLKFNIGSAHLLSTGELNRGFFRATYPVKYLDCRWPGNLLTKSSRIQVSVVNPDGTTQIATTSVKIQNGIFRIDAYGFHYSQPTIVLKPTTDTNVPLANVPSSTVAKPAAKITITCVKGKVSKKVTALKPVCPKGFKKK